LVVGGQSKRLFPVLVAGAVTDALIIISLMTTGINFIFIKPG
jgi:hypothetical protein